ncbi:hypothetical protein C8R46DRAFT_1278340 [Mycena filopes]|nr:hypothetical protein C8R46DRAFT_1278340 [Mycena filopes]
MSGFAHRPLPFWEICVGFPGSPAVNHNCCASVKLPANGLCIHLDAQKAPSLRSLQVVQRRLFRADGRARDNHDPPCLLQAPRGHISRRRQSPPCCSILDQILERQQTVQNCHPNSCRIALKGFLDHDFFSSSPELLACGMRRAPAFRAIRAEALKAAWDLGIILHPSNENAASCFLLDLTEQNDLGSAGRPWATAYISHVRSLAPSWRGLAASTTSGWAGFLMVEALISIRNTAPLLVSPQDQLLLCSAEQPSMESLLVSLQSNLSPPGVPWESMTPYLFHVTTLARQLYDTVIGDYARAIPLPSPGVERLLRAFTTMHAVLTLTLTRIDAVLANSEEQDGPAEMLARAYAYGNVFSFSGLVLPFYRALRERHHPTASNSTSTSANSGSAFAESPLVYTTEHERRAHDLALQGLHLLARGMRYLAPIHYSPVHWATIHAYAELGAEEADRGGGVVGSEDARDLGTLADEIKLLGYSLEIVSTPPVCALLERLEGHVNRSRSRYMAETGTGNVRPTEWAPGYKPEGDGLDDIFGLGSFDFVVAR